jgi:choline dehydrogenase-like flavoprotein
LARRGWNFASVLPYFSKLERDLNFSGAYHGKDGPITIRAIGRGPGPAS